MIPRLAAAALLAASILAPIHDTRAAIAAVLPSAGQAIVAYCRANPSLCSGAAQHVLGALGALAASVIGKCLYDGTILGFKCAGTSEGTGPGLPAPSSGRYYARKGSGGPWYGSLDSLCKGEGRGTLRGYGDNSSGNYAVCSGGTVYYTSAVFKPAGHCDTDGEAVEFSDASGNCGYEPSTDANIVDLIDDLAAMNPDALVQVITNSTPLRPGTDYEKPVACLDYFGRPVSGTYCPTTPTNPGTGNPPTGGPDTTNPGTSNPPTGGPNTTNPGTGNPSNPGTNNPSNPGTNNPDTPDTTDISGIASLFVSAINTITSLISQAVTTATQGIQSVVSGVESLAGVIEAEFAALGQQLGLVETATRDVEVATTEVGQKVAQVHDAIDCAKHPGQVRCLETGEPPPDEAPEAEVLEAQLEPVQLGMPTGCPAPLQLDPDLPPLDYADICDTLETYVRPIVIAAAALAAALMVISFVRS